MKFILPLLIAIFTFGYKSSAQHTQNVIRDVILLNSKPHVVKMNIKGDILSFEQELADSYAAVQRVTRKEIIEEVIAMENVTPAEPAIPEPNPEPISEEPIEIEPVVEEIVDNSEVEEIEKTSNNSEISYEYQFAFDHRDATLSGNSVSQLKFIAELLNEHKEANCRIESFYSESVDVSKILSRNRSNAIKELLVSNGIESSRILIVESDNDDWGNNQVNLSIH